MKTYYEPEDVYNQFLITAYSGENEFLLADTEDNDEVWVIVEEYDNVISGKILICDNTKDVSFDHDFEDEESCIEAVYLAYEFLNPYEDSELGAVISVDGPDDDYVDPDDEEAEAELYHQQTEIENREEELADETENYLHAIAWGWDEIVGADAAAELIADLTDKTCELLAEYGIAVYRPRFVDDKYVESPYEKGVG